MREATTSFLKAVGGDEPMAKSLAACVFDEALSKAKAVHQRAAQLHKAIPVEDANPVVMTASLNESTSLGVPLTAAEEFAKAVGSTPLSDVVDCTRCGAPTANGFQMLPATPEGVTVEDLGDKALCAKCETMTKALAGRECETCPTPLTVFTAYVGYAGQLADATTECLPCALGRMSGGDDTVAKAIGVTLEASLRGYLEADFFKSPRRAASRGTNVPPEGMPEELHAGWHALAGLKNSDKVDKVPNPKFDPSKGGGRGNSKMIVRSSWTDPDHPHHAAYRAHGWMAGATTLQRYGDAARRDKNGNPVISQRMGHDMATLSAAAKKAVAAREHVKRTADAAASNPEFAAHLDEQHAHVKAVQEHYERLGQFSSIKTPHPSVAAARDATITAAVGRSHLTHEEVQHVSEAIRAHVAGGGKLSDSAAMRAEHFDNHHDDAADSHLEDHGSYEGYHVPLTTIHPEHLATAEAALGASKNKAHIGTHAKVAAALDAVKQHPDHA